MTFNQGKPMLSSQSLLRILLSLAVISFLSGCVLMETEVESKISHKPKYEEFVASGDLLPLETILDLEGNKLDLKSSSKKKLIILFATWCSDSNRALDALNTSTLLEDKELDIVAIAREESVETVSAWRDAKGIKVPLAADPDRTIYKRFAAAGIPRFIMVDEDNKIIRMALAEGVEQLKLIKW